MKKKLSLFHRIGQSWRKKGMCLATILICVIVIFSLCNIIQFSNLNLLTLPDSNSPQIIIENDSVNIFEIFGQAYKKINNAELIDVMNQSKIAGAKAWKKLNLGTPIPFMPKQNVTATKDLACPTSILASGDILHSSQTRSFPLSCGMKSGSTITIRGKPQPAQWKYNPLTTHEEKVSQFIVEVHGLKLNKNEMHSPTLLHFNPRLYGDWSGKSIIEHNFRHNQDKWGKAHRCEGNKHDEKVDGLPQCEEWIQGNDTQALSKMEKKSTWNRKVSHFEKEKLDRNYPFVEGQEFSLVIQAGIEGFHVDMDNRHISSFPYQRGFSIQEASEIIVGGDVEVDSIMATSLPQDDTWKALPIPTKEIELFVGVMSSTNHFAERMAIRKTWFQSNSVQSSKVAARFFVAMHEDNDVNLRLTKEASYYGDIIILPFIDRYDIVVLKTLEICKFGLYNVTAKYIMKCDDDTFVRIDGVLEEIQKSATSQGFYMGTMNYGHGALRKGKWAVSVEEWPDHLKYPKYANGPGYVLSRDIVQYVVEQSEKEELQLFKMEDVNVGLWANKFTIENPYPVRYVDIKRFAQDHCQKDYICVHHQSPRQMMCLWDKLVTTNDATCCN